MNSTDIYTILSSKPHNPHYLKRYINFIIGCNLKNSATAETYLGYTEKHHICPKAKSLFPEYSSFYLHPWNMIRLTASQHFVAHHILANAYNNRATVSSFVHMAKFADGGKRHHLFSKMRIRLSEQMKRDNPMNDPEIRQKMTDTKKKLIPSEKTKAYWVRQKGIPCTAAEKQKLSDFWTGVKKAPRTQEHRTNHRNSQQTIWYITPFGRFVSAPEAGKSSGVSHNTIMTRCIRNVDKIVKKSHLDKSFNGKTWRELGYYTTPIDS